MAQRVGTLNQNIFRILTNKNKEKSPRVIFVEVVLRLFYIAAVMAAPQVHSTFLYYLVLLHLLYETTLSRDVECETLTIKLTD